VPLRPSSDLLAFAAAIGLIAAAGCRDDPGAPFSCECAYLTDMDDEVKQREVVCAETAARAAGVARTCAARGAAAPVQACTCAPVEGGSCRVGACLSPPK
jgi:hypothetical protein